MGLDTGCDLCQTYHCVDITKPYALCAGGTRGGVDCRAPAILEVSRQFGENTNAEPQAFSRTPHVLNIAVSMKQHFLEHTVF